VQKDLCNTICQKRTNAVQQTDRLFDYFVGDGEQRRRQCANGVRSLLAYCFTCHHEAVLGVEDYPDDVPVPAFAPRMVCTHCGMIGADARPNWSERSSHGSM
jgi:hypothetical protein